jgi:hypothetical protein
MKSSAIKLIAASLVVCALTSTANAQDSASASWWHDVRICNDARQPFLRSVLIGIIGEVGTANFRLVLRSEDSKNLPGYLAGLPGVLIADIDARSLEVTPSDAIGYTNGKFDTFRMPNGVVLSCTPF